MKQYKVAVARWTYLGNQYLLGQVVPNGNLIPNVDLLVRKRILSEELLEQPNTGIVKHDAPKIPKRQNKVRGKVRAADAEPEGAGSGGD